MLFLLPLAAAAVPLPDGVTPIATFDGDSKTTFKWKLVNDPVMGGVSESKFELYPEDQSLVWSGEVKIVPKLAAPGFCNLEMADPFAKMQSLAETTHLVMRARTSSPEYLGFKMSFAAKTLDPQFKSYKANFNVSGGGWNLVSIPWTSFSNDWSPFTGDCDTKDPTGKTHNCCSSQHPEVCPTQKDLASIQSLGFWTEGSSGNFTLEIQWVGGTNNISGAKSPKSNTCPGNLEDKLRFNVSGRLADDYLPFQAPPTETLAEAVCCDSDFADFAEPEQFFDRPDVNLFGVISKDGQTTFYDSACGIPLFTAPGVNRTFSEWKQESIDHGWPSFRDGEVHTENLKVSDGTVTSTCGTHLGSMLPDDKGDRYCIDLSCISGRKK